MPDEACAPEVVSDPAVMGGDPVVSGTRVPALTILAYLRAGHSDMDIHEDYPTLPPGAVDAVRIWAEHRYPSEDGPGSGTRVELSVRVLVGLERSTVIAADPVTGRALTREVLPHGREADVAAAAVEAAIRARLLGDPGSVPGGVREPAGEPRE